MPSFPATDTRSPLAAASYARTDPLAAEHAILAALAATPSDVDMRLGAYRFYFYSHRLVEALPHAEFLIAHAARQLNIPADWSAVEPNDADFGALEETPGLYLQSLLAWGYCHARLARTEDGRKAFAKVLALDPRDRFGARLLLRVTETAPEDGNPP